MSHNHTIQDNDLHFVIDPITRTIESQSDNRYLTQLDHESSRLTFKIPLTIEGHDMSKCDRIEIHFTNITKKKDEQNDGVYIVKDSDREVIDDTLVFSWLVRKESTSYAGRLNFSIAFLCHDEDANLTYEWSTTESKYIQILTRLEHTVTTLLKYPDLYEQLKKELAEEYKLDESEVNALITKYLDENPIETDFPQTTEEDSGKVLTIDSNGDKILELPPIISYKYGYKIQESSTQVLFCLDTGIPMLRTFTMPSKKVLFRVYKDGEYVSGADLNTVKTFDTIKVQECTNTRIVLICTSRGGITIYEYYYYFNTNSWSLTSNTSSIDALQYSFPLFKNEIAYEPTEDYHPASKKYVDSFMDTDESVLDMLLELDTINAVTNENGYILTDENDNILLW